MLEAVVPALLAGSLDAEAGAPSTTNLLQLLRVLQLVVEHLWQMRESHAVLYPAYTRACTAANRYTQKRHHTKATVQQPLALNPRHP
jgi:hypothetical protein